MSEPVKADHPGGNYVGMPAALWLEEFGSQVWSAFGHPPYLVGSATTSKQWRDVDVRLMLPDEDYVAAGFGDPMLRGGRSARWSSLCMAYSALGKQMTGLPIDFQIQSYSSANKLYGKKDGHWRVPIGLVEVRIVTDEQALSILEPKALTPRQEQALKDFRADMKPPQVEEKKPDEHVADNP